MKKLGKLNINPEKLMKNEELLILRGGYGDHYVSCIDHDTWNPCGGWVMQDCAWARNYCEAACPGWDELMCL